MGSPEYEGVAEKPLRSSLSSKSVGTTSRRIAAAVFSADPQPCRIRLWGCPRSARFGERGSCVRCTPVTWASPLARPRYRRIVVLFAFAFAGAALDAILYRSLLAGVDDATAGRVRDIAQALQSNSARRPRQRALLTTDQRVVAIQVIAPDGKVVKRSGSAPETAIPAHHRVRPPICAAAYPTMRCPADDMRVSGQKVATPSGEYTVIVGGGSEAVEATARTVALLLACGAPIIVAVAAGGELLARSPLTAVGGRDAQQGGRNLDVRFGRTGTRYPTVATRYRRPGGHHERNAVAYRSRPPRTTTVRRRRLA